MPPPASVTVRTAGAARLTTFCAMMSGSLSPARVKSRTTSSTGVCQTSPCFGTIATITRRRPPNVARIFLSTCTNGWFDGRLFSMLNSVRSFRMPLATNAVAMATRSSTIQRWRTMNRT